MRYTRLFQYLVVFFFVFSCVDDNRVTKDKGVHHPQTAETRQKNQPEPTPASIKKKSHVPGEILVQFRENIDPAALKNIQAAVHLEVIRKMTQSNLYLMKITGNTSVEQVMKQLQQHQEVVFSEPNFVRKKL